MSIDLLSQVNLHLLTAHTLGARRAQQMWANHNPNPRQGHARTSTLPPFPPPIRPPSQHGISNFASWSPIGALSYKFWTKLVICILSLVSIVSSHHVFCTSWLCMTGNLPPPTICRCLTVCCGAESQPRGLARYSISCHRRIVRSLNVLLCYRPKYISLPFVAPLSSFLILSSLCHYCFAPFHPRAP